MLNAVRKELLPSASGHTASGLRTALAQLGGYCGVIVGTSYRSQRPKVIAARPHFTRLADRLPRQDISWMTKRPKMALDEARAILHRWDRRRPGERDLVLEADKLLAEAWGKRHEEQRKKRSLSF